MSAELSPITAPEEWPDRLPFGIREVPVSRIIVGERHRKEFGDLQGLAASIMDEGLLQPIGLTPDWQLVFGERRLRAVRDVLNLASIEVRVVNVTSILAGEYAENEMRQDFTPSERVAIVEAMRERLGKRLGSNQHVRRGAEDGVDRGPPAPADAVAAAAFPDLPYGRTRDLIAERAGFESGRQLDRASNVVRLGVPALVEAMDRGAVSITAAAAIAREAPRDQAAIVSMPEPDRIEELRRRKEAAAQLRASVIKQEETTGPTAYTGFVKKNGRLPSKEEAKTIATLDHRVTPAEGGKPVKPAAPPTKKEDRARKKLIDGYGDEIWRAQQAVQLLEMNSTDPSVLMEHVSYIERGIFDEKLRAARAWLNRFAREYRRHAK